MDGIFIILLCLFLNALFAAYEMAFIAVRKAELVKLANTGDDYAERLLGFKQNPERTLSVIQIGITLVSAIAAAVGGAGAAESIAPYFVQRFGWAENTADILAVVLVVIPITYLSVVVGELVPKALALRNAMKIVMSGARALMIADRVLSPMVTVLETSTKFILNHGFKKSKIETASDPAAIEIESLSPMHREYMFNMAGMKRRKVKDILVPWSQVDAVRVQDEIQDVVKLVFHSGYTRLPVLEGEQVVGILHTKEFMALKEAGETHWQKIIRPVIRTHPTDSLLAVLRLMQERRSHMAIVVSALGERIGLVTMEDILEEVIGDIADEDDDGYVRKIFASRANRRPPDQHP